ncbi:chloride channel protein [Taibaiella koreensis]|uniref:chloride channel protein n=1 Tax=Taibaiella koreensis TaxID=1268548 RepID=UPI001F096ECE|nr:chloride channel protein [Taibaiella koreensis]
MSASDPARNKGTMQNGIPVSPSLHLPDSADTDKRFFQKKRLLQLSLAAVFVAVLVSLVAKVLIYLINLVTNIAFFGSFSLAAHSPAGNHLGWWVVILPVIGGLIVGLMALYGSKAIRGHGIPEAMEQILVNQSRIKPVITFLKPLSSAIAIGTGGPFGAEGPIIATGGALGSTLGQYFRITSNERKIILASGATAGMSAIFGTPIAAIFLAIELLLFEFSPKAILPVALACITGAAGHHLLFESGPVFPMPDVLPSSNTALGAYSLIGLLVGFVALGITRILYIIEDLFERLPVHWMWWPAIGGLAVGVVGYFAPHTLGVGYDNITHVLSGTAPLSLVLSLLLLKFLSWSIALGSGTSGGTLAPLLTIGGACGAALGMLMLYLFPQSGVSVALAALVGMAAMFAGASRAYLTSVAFALEATMQSHALLPLLGACTAAYLVSFFLMENTIMTEKIARRGISTPDAYEPDILSKLTVAQVLLEESTVFTEDSTIGELQVFLEEQEQPEHHFVVVDNEGWLKGYVDVMDLFHLKPGPQTPLSTLMRTYTAAVKSSDSLARALAVMSEQNTDVLPVCAVGDNRSITGVLRYKDILSAYRIRHREQEVAAANLSLKKQRIRMMIRGRKLIAFNRH